MRTLYLHVGAPKCASSSIQVNLRRHRGRLQTIGLDYLASFDETFQYPHRQFISTGNANALAYSMRWQRDPTEYAAFEPTRVFDTLRRCLPDDKDVVLSHEDLIFASVGYLTQLRDVLGDAGWNIKVVLLIRDQLSWHVSNFVQHVVQLGYAGSYAELVGRSLKTADWNIYCSKFIALVGPTDTTVRVIDGEHRRANILDFFLGTIAHEFKPLGELQTTNENVGLSLDDAEIVAAVNSTSDDTAKRRRLIGMLAESRTRPRTKSPRVVQEIIRSYYHEGNSKLIDKILPPSDASILASRMSADIDASRPKDELEARLARIVGDLL